MCIGSSNPPLCLGLPDREPEVDSGWFLERNWKLEEGNFTCEELSSWVKCTRKMRQRLKDLLGEPRQNVSWGSAENWLGSGNWRVVAVGGERESYLEPTVPVTVVTCCTGKWSPLPVIGTEDQNVDLLDDPEGISDPPLCLCCPQLLKHE